MAKQRALDSKVSTNERVQIEEEPIFAHKDKTVTEVERLVLFAQNDPLSTTAQLEGVSRSASRGSSISHSW